MNNLRRVLTISAVSILAVASFVQPALGVTTSLGTGDCVQQVDGLTGSVARSGNYCLIAIKGPAVSSGSSGSWIVPAEVTEVDVLVVGGGGGGGNFGGGGAGALYEGTEIAVSPAETIAITVGSGGAGSSSTTAAGSNGSTTSFDDIVAFGGGGGSSTNQDASATVYAATSPGGSGGGAMASPVGTWKTVGNAAGTSNDKQDPVAVGSAAGSAGVGLRNKGGDSNAVYVYFSNANYSYNVGGSPGVGLSISFWQGAGGGGAGEAGGDITWVSDGTVGKTGDVFNTILAPGKGGSGFATTLVDPVTATELAIGEIVGDDVYFAGGGGGRGNFDAASTEPKNWDYSPTTFLNYSLNGIGGTGGGGGIGNGRVINGVAVSPGNPGFANTGGGGKATGAGGSGIVLIRYVIPGTEPPVEPPVDPPVDEEDVTALADTGPSYSVMAMGSLSAIFIALGIAAIQQSRGRRRRT
jgi:hypothetical protein